MRQYTIYFVAVALLGMTATTQAAEAKNDYGSKGNTYGSSSASSAEYAPSSENNYKPESSSHASAGTNYGSSSASSAEYAPSSEANYKPESSSYGSQGNDYDDNSYGSQGNDYDDSDDNS
ncbi:hypothetical protein IWW50_004102, partial [Coemansia erecta]